jgi:hypothetical protein
MQIKAGTAAEQRDTYRKTDESMQQQVIRCMTKSLSNFKNRLIRGRSG